MPIDPSSEMYGSDPSYSTPGPEAPKPVAAAAINKPPPVQLKAASPPKPSKIPLTAGRKVGAGHSDPATLQAMNAGIERRINQQPPPPPQFKGIPYKPEPLIPKEHFTKMVGMSLLFAAMAGKSSGQPMIASLNAFTGAMQGSLQGRHEVAAQHLEEWKAQSKEALDSFQAQTQSYWDTINDNHKRIDETLKAMNIKARVLHDQEMISMQGNFQGILGVLQQRGNMLKGAYVERSGLEKALYSGLANEKQKKEITDKINAIQAKIDRDSALQDERLTRVDVTDVPGSMAGIDVEGSIQAANDAIAGGLDPKIAIERLKQNGIDVTTQQ